MRTGKMVYDGATRWDWAAACCAVRARLLCERVCALLPCELRVRACVRACVCVRARACVGMHVRE